MKALLCACVGGGGKGFGVKDTSGGPKPEGPQTSPVTSPFASPGKSCRASALVSVERRRMRRAVMAPVRAYVPDLRLQEHRTRLDLTQEAVAEELGRLAWVHYGMRVGVNADMVGKWERGEKRPSKLYRRLLCLLYQATEEELGLRRPISDVNRRDFLRHSALAGAAVLAFPEWLSRAGATEASDRLAWALERPSRVDLATVSDMETITAAHRRSYRQLSVHALLPQTESQFEAVTELLQRPQPIAMRQRLIATARETAMLAGTLRFMDLDDFELGYSNLELAMT